MRRQVATGRVRGVLLLAILSATCLLLVVACSGPETSGDQSTQQPPPDTLATVVTVPAQQQPTNTVQAEATATATASPTFAPSPTPEPSATATQPPEVGLAITSLALHDIDGEPLRYLSIDQHPYFEGDTLIHGTIAITVPPDTSLSTLLVTVLAGEQEIASGGLSHDAANLLLGAPDPDGVLAIEQSQLLFVLPSSEMMPPDDAHDRQLTVQVTAVATDGSTASLGYGPVGQLVLYRGENRYEDRDEARGGDDWLLPSVLPVVTHFEDIVIGDISDMNGGPYPPHVGHQDGNEIDAWFPGYNELDRHTALQILEHLNDPEYGSRIELVYVTYERVEGDPIWETIRDETLADGRAAIDVIQPYPGHDTHFHWRITPE